MARLWPVLALCTSAIFWPAALRADEVAARPALDLQLGIANPVTAVSLDQLTATRERPLFSESRRPRTAPPPGPSLAAAPNIDPPAPPPSPPDLIFYGVVLDRTGARAYVDLKKPQKILGVRVGDEVDGWKVAQIDLQQLVLLLDDRSVTLLLNSADRSGGDHMQLARRAGRVLEYNPAGILTARHVSKSRPDAAGPSPVAR
jgi:hypothetical protein